ncbi:hypothetical protein [Sulfitobacter sp. PS-8MA]|uniref:hypothetical protein n=1 Tax=Sulfitobacter sp. PS-8MA TaxID=3237707 RepID=UPI0034C5B607
MNKGFFWEIAIERAHTISVWIKCLACLLQSGSAALVSFGRHSSSGHLPFQPFKVLLAQLVKRTLFGLLSSFYNGLLPGTRSMIMLVKARFARAH